MRKSKHTHTHSHSHTHTYTYTHTPRLNHARRYNVVEYCRRRLREIVYCSDISLCLNSMRPNIQDSERTEMVDGSLRLDGGDPMVEVSTVNT